MTLDEKINILDKLRGGMSAAQLAWHSVHILFQSLTFRWYFTLMINFPMKLYDITQFTHK
jgi:hypothetical protein